MGKAFTIYLIVSICVMVTMVAIIVSVAAGSRARNADLRYKVQSFGDERRNLEGRISDRDTILGNIRLNSHGKGRIDKIRIQLDEWDRLRRWERKGMQPDDEVVPTGLDVTLDVAL